MITEVLITIDTEFSIAGAFTDLEKFPPLGKSSVVGLVGARENGLGFILDALDTFNIDATFFVEAINTRYFGYREMGYIVDRIKAEGQDIQLHVHPVWAVFNGKSCDESGRFPKNDSLMGRDESQIIGILDVGMRAFDAWGLARPVAVRTGGLLVSASLYTVFRRFGLRVSSSVGTGIYMPSEARLQLDNGKQTLHGVSEIPVTTFRDMPVLRPWHRKSLQITSCSWPEIRSVLLKANALGVRRVTLLTHPFEFFKRKDFRHSRIIRNRVNQKRFLKLCSFLSENKEKFTSTSFAAGAAKWSHEPDIVDPVIMSAGDLQTGIRKFHNGLNDAIWPY